MLQLCVRFMRDSIAVHTVCEFVQVCLYERKMEDYCITLPCPFTSIFLQAALTYQQTTLQEECLAFIEASTEVMTLIIYEEVQNPYRKVARLP